jgi:hypothetical protein
MIFLEVTCKNGTKAFINLANITTITQNNAKDTVYVSFTGNENEYVTLQTSIEEFGKQIEAAIYHHKMANQ